MSRGDWDGAAAALFRAVRIDAPDRFTLGGRRFALPPPQAAPAALPALPALPAAGAAAGPAAPEVPPLMQMLSGALYQYVYSRSFDGRLAEAREAVAADPAADAALVARLTAANCTRERWEQGWQIAQVLPSGQVMAQRGAASRAVWPGQFLSKDGPGVPPRPGSQISLCYLKESVSVQPGFYYVFGETPEEESHGFGLVRVYWNVDAPGAPALVRLLSARLNRFHVPFRFKCSVTCGQYERTDVAVAYLAKRYFPVFADLLIDIHPQVRASLAGDVPLFAKRLAAGVGVAEDPGNGESFGQHRCRVLAQTLWSCFLAGSQSLSARLAEFGRQLGRNGVDPRRLYLNAGSLDGYELPAPMA